MGGGSPERVSTPAGAVFLSYASQDAEAAQKICDAFRAAGIEVWFDKSELRGGDVWDRQIREQIHNCRLFIPVISANTEARDEGYFRLIAHRLSFNTELRDLLVDHCRRKPFSQRGTRLDHFCRVHNPGVVYPDLEKRMLDARIAE
jgi:hypothetical protein